MDAVSLARATTRAAVTLYDALCNALYVTLCDALYDGTSMCLAAKR